MSEPSNDKEFKIELLKLRDEGDTNNYGEFETKAKLKLLDLDLWKYIQGPLSIPPVIPALVKKRDIEAPDAHTGVKRTVTIEGNEAEVDAAVKAAAPWKKGDLRARRLITEAVPQTKISIIRHAATAREVWLALREEYRPINALRAQRLHQTIMSHKCEPGSDVGQWIDTIRALYADLVDQDPTRMSDYTFARIIADLVPVDDTWRSVARSIRDDMDKAEVLGRAWSSSRVIQRIKEEDWMLNGSRLQRTTEVLHVGNDRKRSYLAANLATGPYPKRSREDRYDIRCQNKYCENAVGHLAKDCWVYGGGKQGQYPDWWKGRRDLHIHPANRKPRLPNKGSSQSSTKGNQPRINTATDNREDDSVNADDTRASIAAFTAFTDSYGDESGDDTTDLVEDSIICMPATSGPDEPVKCHAAALDKSTKRDNPFKCYLDTGATRHIVFDRSFFSTYRTIKPITVTGFDSNLNGSGVGSGDIVMQDLDGSSLLKLTDVLHVPSARLNLVSWGTLDRRGMKLTGGDGKLVLSYPGIRNIVGNIMPNNLYRLNIKPKRSSLGSRIEQPSLIHRISAPVAVAVDHQVDFSTAY